MSDAKKSAVKEILENPTSGRISFFQARANAFTNPAEMEMACKLTDEATEEMKGSRSQETKSRAATVAGIGLWIQEKYEQAATALDEAGSSAPALYIRGLCLIETKDYAGAVKSFQKAAKAGEDAFVCAMGEAEAFRLSGNREEALARIRQFQQSHDQQAELHYQKGRCLEMTYEVEPAISSFEKAVELNPEHVGALFRLAYWSDLRGNDDLALACYEKAATIQPVRQNVLQNLGIAYEDRGDYERAEATFARILQSRPTDEVARLYSKDAAASINMFYDEATERKQHRTAAMLRVPLSEFELSARCRACLEKMNIRTLGDLARLNEDDIAGSKNFGETSLAELRQLLESKGLHFGLGRVEPVRQPAAIATPQQGGTLAKPVGELDLSIRSLKCVRALGCETVGDLVQKSDKDLLGCANFGQTSLQEIKRKLANLGLALKARE